MSANRRIGSFIWRRQSWGGFGQKLGGQVGSVRLPFAQGPDLGLAVRTGKQLLSRFAERNDLGFERVRSLLLSPPEADGEDDGKDEHDPEKLVADPPPAKTAEADKESEPAKPKEAAESEDSKTS